MICFGVNKMERRFFNMSWICTYKLFALSAACANGKDNMWGIAPKAKIIPICAVGKDGSANSENIIKGIYWAIDNNADIINLSLGKETDIGDCHFSQSPICNTVVS